jgi:hypothetical protein
MQQTAGLGMMLWIRVYDDSGNVIETLNTRMDANG